MFPRITCILRQIQNNFSKKTFRQATERKLDDLLLDFILTMVEKNKRIHCILWVKRITLWSSLSEKKREKHLSPHLTMCPCLRVLIHINWIWRRFEVKCKLKIFGKFLFWHSEREAIKKEIQRGELDLLFYSS